jgi:hypothetical protein
VTDTAAGRQVVLRKSSEQGRTAPMFINPTKEVWGLPPSCSQSGGKTYTCWKTKAFSANYYEGEIKNPNYMNSWEIIKVAKLQQNR